MKKAATLFCLLLIAPFTAAGQNQEVSLIAVECVAVKGACEQQNLECNASYGHIVRYRSKEIGRFWASVWGAPTIDGHIAFLYGDVGSNLGYPKEFRCGVA